MFKRFYRVDRARAMDHSYGLGLSIAESIVSEHGGKIRCEGKADGNVFTVTLPTVKRRSKINLDISALYDRFTVRRLTDADVPRHA